MNKYNTRTFLDFFTDIKCICQPILAFLDTEMTVFFALSFTSTSEILTLSFAWGLKKIPLSGGAFLGPNPRFLRVAMQGWSDWHKNGRGSSSPFPALAPQYARYTLPLSCCAQYLEPWTFYFVQRRFHVFILYWHLLAMFFSMFVISRKRFAKCWFFSVLGFSLFFFVIFCSLFLVFLFIGV